MPGEIVITSSDSAACCLEKAGIEASFIAWRDVLFEGPITPAADLAGLSQVRADYIARQTWAYNRLAHVELIARDRRLEASEEAGRVTLWLEHDLADQLQLLQLLDWFNAHRRPEDTLWLVESKDDLTNLSRDQAAALAAAAQPVSEMQLQLGAYAWQSLQQPTPEAFASLTAINLSALPHLRAAVLRLLEELPGTLNSLGRTEQQILNLMHGHIVQARQLYESYGFTESARFLDDWSFYAVLDRLGLQAEPLVAGHPGTPFNPNMTLTDWRRYVTRGLKLTLLGQNVLTGREDNARHTLIDRWWGGTHLSNGYLWRWDAKAKHLLPPVHRVLH